jgi:hypothetical protein
MIRDDQDMTEEWIVRVAGREYGPADIDTLREWKAEGRVIPTNEARPASAKLWTLAAEIPGLFGGESLSTLTAPPPLDSTASSSHSPTMTSRSFGGILAETLRTYLRGLFQFIPLALLVLLPSVCGQLIALWMESVQASNADLRVVAAGGFAFLMFVFSLVMWPIYLAGIQIFAAEIAAGRRLGFFAGLNEAVRFWPRVAGLCLFVYGVFFLLTLFALLIAAMIVAGGSSVFVIFLALALLGLQVWMFGRFFVNVLFWQQFAVLENLGAMDALRESRNLAHSRRDLPWFRRPAWRGAFMASLWFAVVMAVTLGPQWGTFQHYFNELMKIQDPQALVQQMTEAQKASGFNISAFVLGIVEKLLHPLLGIAFVVLYLDSKTHLHSHMADDDPIG